MTDAQINFTNMGLGVHALLAKARPQWSPVYARLQADFDALGNALGVFGGKAQARSGSGSTGYTDAKDLAEIAALDAALPVLRGLKAVQLDAPDPALAKLAAHTRTTLDALRGQTQLATLRELHTLALPRATALAGELVTAAHLVALDAKIKAYAPLLGAPRQAIGAGVVLREQAVEAIGAARAALKRLDVRVANLADQLPELVAQYRQARIIVDAGHGPKGAAGQAK